MIQEDLVGFSTPNPEHPSQAQRQWRERVALSKENRLYKAYLKQLSFHDLISESQGLSSLLKSNIPLSEKTKLYSKLVLEEMNGRLNSSQNTGESFSTNLADR